MKKQILLLTVATLLSTSAFAEMVEMSDAELREESGRILPAEIVKDEAAVAIIKALKSNPGQIDALTGKINEFAELHKLGEINRSIVEQQIEQFNSVAELNARFNTEMQNLKLIMMHQDMYNDYMAKEAARRAIVQGFLGTIGQNGTADFSMLMPGNILAKYPDLAPSSAGNLIFLSKPHTTNINIYFER